MNVEHILDTNIFVYMLDETDDLKRRWAEQLVRRSILASPGCEIAQERDDFRQCLDGERGPDSLAPRPGHLHEQGQHDRGQAAAGCHAVAEQRAAPLAEVVGELAISWQSPTTYCSG